MLDRFKISILTVATVALASMANLPPAAAQDRQFINVELDPAAGQSVHGRLLLFARESGAATAEVLKNSKGKSGEVSELDANPGRNRR